jgi:hypothetical protein
MMVDRMRILVVSADGGFAQGPICAEMATSLRALGHEVTLATRGHLLGAGRHAVAALRRRPPGLVIGYNFSSLFSTECGGDFFGNLGVPNACYFFDNPLDHYDERSRDRAFHASVRALQGVACFSWDRVHARRYAALGAPRVAYLPPGYLAARYEPYLQEVAPELICDVGVMGNIANPARRALLERLAEMPLRVHAHVAHASSFTLSPELLRTLRPPLDTDAERLRFYRSSAIYLETPSNTAMTGINVKCLNAMAAGTFVIAPRSPELAEAFSEDEIATYGDAQEMLTKIDFYLARDGERRRIAENGQRAVRERHAFQHRVGELLERMRDWRLLDAR